MPEILACACSETHVMNNKYFVKHEENGVRPFRIIDCICYEQLW